MGKSGVGLVLSSAGGASVTLHHVTVTTDTPGFTAEIEAGGTASGPFHAVSSPKTVNRHFATARRLSWPNWFSAIARSLRSAEVSSCGRRT